MGWFSWIKDKVKSAARSVLGKKLTDKIVELGKKAVGAVRNIPGVKQVVGGIQYGLDKAGQLAGKATSALMDTDIGKGITGGLKSAAGFIDSKGPLGLGLKRKVEELESGLRSGKLARGLIGKAALGPVSAVM